MKSFTTLSAIAALTAVVSAQTAGVTTRYWDCCKPSCGWTGKAAFSSPVQTCDINDNPITNGGDAVNGCPELGGGSSFMCSSQQPWAINDNLAYGFSAVTGSQSEASSCCACYALTFTSGAVAGKTMVVQATNIGYDVSSTQFDLAIPGGGVGAFPGGCTKEWNAPSGGWGAQYGGVSSASACSSLPSKLQAGCNFRFGWLGGADNPSVTYKQVACPAELTAKSGCKRDDDSSFPAAPTGSASSPASTVSTVVVAASSAKAPASSAKSSTTSTVKTTSTTAPNGAAQTPYGQCGGQGYSGPTACGSGTTCKVQNQWYSQCL